jgi:hypothetical protein
MSDFITHRADSDDPDCCPDCCPGGGTGCC